MTTGKILVAAIVLGAAAGEALPHILNRTHAQVQEYILVILLPVFLYVAWKTPSGTAVAEPAPEKPQPQKPADAKEK